jgi:tetraprenyl-beta-curcumene synthase
VRPIVFAAAARRYWLSVYPQINREAQHWHQRAKAIPDPVLRELALEAQHAKRGNVEGSAAFAAFAPQRTRTAVVKAQVAFQSAYDYVDTVSEQPHRDPAANGHQLHLALLAAIEPAGEQSNYYEYFPHTNDGGYLREIVAACRSGLAALPSLDAVAEPIKRATERIVTYQSLNLRDSQGGRRKLAAWAQERAPADTELRWWETAASAGSSLGLFALIAAAGRRHLEPSAAVAIERAYWPWIGALHSLLDSLVDEPEDAATGQGSLLDYYESPQEATMRLQLLAHKAAHAARSLPRSQEHVLILAGMASFYLTAPEASSPVARRVSSTIGDTLGRTATAAKLVMHARRAAGRMQPRSKREPLRQKHDC